MRKDIILRVIRLIIWLGLIIYAWWIYKNWYIISVNAEWNLYAIGFVGILGLFITLMWILMPCFPKMRLIQFLFWFFLIVFSYYFFRDNPDKFIFIRDILRVLGALLVILGPFGVCVPQKCVKQEEEKKIEIIEV